MVNTKLAAYIGTNFQKTCQSAGLTQAEVAKRAGTNINYYAKLERGEAIPSLVMLEKVIRALKSSSSNILPF